MRTQTLWLSPSHYCIVPKCSKRFLSSLRWPPINFRTCGGFFDVATAQKRAGELNVMMAGETFWNNREKAQQVIDELNSLRNKIEPLLAAEKQLEDFRILLELGQGEPEAAQLQLQTEMERDITKYLKDLDALELKVFLNGKYDSKNCILSINAGAGGTEAQDWAEMLSRMYTRWAEARGWEVEVTDALPGEGAGLKSVTMLMKGENAYGFAKAERGVHRLVRISPFDSNKRRHTSFASIDVIAEIEETDSDIVIPPTEFHVDTFRSGGKGGQNVNKVETAVRITHIPTGLVVASQTQRSQHQNRATAMRLLLSRILAQRVDSQKAEMERFYGEKGSVSWGNQIRSYVFQPYRMVKDLRTGVETSNVQGVMDGDLDPFVNGWLRAGCPTKRMQGVKDEEE
ncbi:MAG TPA: peptide chain release factor 2 [Pseudomonadales bacterium]|nr:peptide chain release factor 2 [Pseudomonadales bacterium]